MDFFTRARVWRQGLYGVHLDRDKISHSKRFHVNITVNVPQFSEREREDEGQFGYPSALSRSRFLAQILMIAPCCYKVVATSVIPK